MGKRSSFERKTRDFYPTPEEAVQPLLPFVKDVLFVEPCAGDGALVNTLTAAGLHCVYAADLEPQHPTILQADCMNFTGKNMQPFDYIITNPPWSRSILHPIIETFASVAPTWLLIDADWMHTKQAAPYLRYCLHIVSVGRVTWIPESKYPGKDNCCWYLFHDAPWYDPGTLFTGQQG